MTVALNDDGAEDRHVLDETLWARRLQVLSLRNAGMTYQQIANAQGISPAMVRRDEQIALRELASGQIDLIIAKHRSVVLDAQRANYPAMLDGSDRKAQVAATKIIFDGLTHEAKLLGLYAPTRVVTGVSEVEFSERFVDLISQVSPDTLKELLRGSTGLARHAGQHADQPVDAEVVTFPGNAGPGAADAALAAPPAGPPADAPGGQPGAGVDAAPARDEPADDDDDWSNIGT